MLTYFGRKARLPFGAQQAVCEALDCAKSNVTAVLKGAHRNRAIEKALAAHMVPRTSVTEAFGPPGPERIHRERRKPRRRAPRTPAPPVQGKPLTGKQLETVLQEVM